MNKVKPYQESLLSKKDQVTKMFDTISEEYDGLNRVISFGADIKWRNKVVNLVAQTNPKTVLDIATGTGDLAIALIKTGATTITGLDISKGMLAVAKKKIEQHNLQNTIQLVLGDSEQLPFADNSFDAITVGFGIRNFETLQTGLSEIYRVLKPNGILVILETSVPTKTPFKQGYKLYCNYLLPVIGKWFSKDKKAYGYLSKSAAKFPYGKTLNNILIKMGFIKVNHLPQTFGVATIYSAFK